MGHRNEELAEALECIGLPLSALPRPVNRLILQHSVSAPELLIPSTARDHIASSPDISGSLAANRPRTMALLTYCLSDIDDSDEDSVKQLVGLPLVPLADGSLGTIEYNEPGSEKMFVASAADAELLRTLPQLLCDSNAIGQATMERCDSP